MSAANASNLSQRPKVAIAGASGFVGTALRRALEPHYHIVALTRSPNRVRMATEEDPTEWRLCDLFSLAEVTQALEDVDYAFYLVHSMLPSSRLTQANFMDLDVLLADNFGRAAEAQQLEQIVYLGGLLPNEREEKLSRHLRSRLEVEQVLRAHATPITSLRAGLIIGPGGSSFRMMVKLVERLPLMVLPNWTTKRTQPIALNDMVRAMQIALGDRRYYSQAFDIGGPDIMTYKEMMERTARVMGKRRVMIPTPLPSPTLSKWWVVLFSGSSMALTGPLVESLRHEMIVDDNPLQRRLADGLTPFETAMRQSLDERGRDLPNPRKPIRKKDDRVIRKDRHVRSVQRLPMPPRRSAFWVAQEYVSWLPRFVWPFLRVKHSGDGHSSIYLRGVSQPLLNLQFQPDLSPEGRHLFFITDGLLARIDPEDYGRLEFRQVLGGRYMIAAIHKFSPRLPWYIYNASQALLHLLVMKGFRRHLKRMVAQTSDEPEPHPA